MTDEVYSTAYETSQAYDLVKKNNYRECERGDLKTLYTNRDIHVEFEVFDTNIKVKKSFRINSSRLNQRGDVFDKSSNVGMPGIAKGKFVITQKQKGEMTDIWTLKFWEEEDKDADPVTEIEPGAVGVRSGYDVPPLTNVITPSLKDVNPEWKSWGSVEPLTDVLLLVVDNDEEFLSCYALLVDVSQSYSVQLGRVYFGKIGNGAKVNVAKVNVALVRCDHDSDQAGSSTNVVRTATSLLKPKVVFSVGCCAGLQRKLAQLGDVVISRNLLTCGFTKIVGDKQQWDISKLDVPRNVGRLIMHAADGWRAPLNDDTDVREVKVHCDGVILSGVKLINSRKECEELLRQYPEAIAIEQEGQGVYSAASDLKMEWVIVKGISHYADSGETETKEWRHFSSIMAASVVAHILKYPDVLKDWPHYQEANSSQTC